MSFEVHSPLEILIADHLESIDALVESNRVLDSTLKAIASLEIEQGSPCETKLNQLKDMVIATTYVELAMVGMKHALKQIPTFASYIALHTKALAREASQLAELEKQQ